MDEAQRKLAACQALSFSMRRNLCLYDLRELELRLANWLIQETYDQGRFEAPVDFREWARLLGFWDAKGIRPKQCMEVFLELQNLGLLAWNQAQNTFELRPYQVYWTGLRRRGLLSETGSSSQELPLRAERLLDEALSSNSRDLALAASSDPAQPPLQGRSRDMKPYYDRLRAGLNNPRELDQLLEDFEKDLQEPSPPGKNPGNAPGKFPGGHRGKIPVTQTVENSAAALPGKFPGNPIASLAPELRAKLAIRPGKNPGEVQPGFDEAWRALQEVDRRKTLLGRFGGDYRQLCESNPGWVVNRGLWALREHERHYQASNAEYRLRDPVGWIGRKAADAGLMRWQGRKS